MDLGVSQGYPFSQGKMVVNIICAGYKNQPLNQGVRFLLRNTSIFLGIAADKAFSEFQHLPYPVREQRGWEPALRFFKVGTKRILSSFLLTSRYRLIIEVRRVRQKVE
jgi:hypothetical protein